MTMNLLAHLILILAEVCEHLHMHQADIYMGPRRLMIANAHRYCYMTAV